MGSDIMTIRGVVPGHSVRIVSVDRIGIQAINLVCREPDGGVSETPLYRDDENRLGIEARGRSWSFDGEANPLRLVTEANRIALAHHFDPCLAIHSSLVDPLPHQISAVHGEMPAPVSPSTSCRPRKPRSVPQSPTMSGWR